jgi:hypothetical protein
MKTVEAWRFAVSQVGPPIPEVVAFVLGRMPPYGDLREKWRPLEAEAA